MWTSKSWFGIDRFALTEQEQEVHTLKKLVEEENLVEAVSEKEAHTQAQKFSKKPEFKDHTFHVVKVNDKHFISIWPSEKHTVASYKGGEQVEK